MNEVKRLERPKQGRKIGGVAIALANYFSVDVTVIRLIWIVLLLPGGLPGFIPYVLCWLAIPPEK